MTERSMHRTGGGPVNGSHVGGGLGTNQIRWLRTNMKPFDDAWKAVQASDAHALKIKSKLQADGGVIDFDSGDGAVQRLRLVERRARRRGPVTA